MDRLRGLVATCATSLLVGVLLSGCGTVNNGAGAPGCGPRWPKASDYVVRAGQTITLSATASECSPRFTSPRRLTVTAMDRQNHRMKLATFQAFPSGAYEKEIRIPKAAAPGALDLYIDGFEIPCSAAASCAAYMTGVDVVSPEVSFDGNSRPNHVASSIAEHIDAALKDSRTPVQLAIVPDGLQAVIENRSYDRAKAAVTRAFKQAQAAQPEKDQAIAAAARLHITNSYYRQADLDRLTLRIAHDQAWQERQHLQLSAWGPDLGTGSVRIRLRHYTDAGAILLTKRYGDAITVSTVDTPFAKAG